MESLILVILVIMPGVWSGDWRVTFNDQCALKGTSIVIKCKYDYPFGHFVTSVTWSKAWLVSGRHRLFPVSNLQSSPDHFVYAGNKRGDCSLKINDVHDDDSGAYYFSFVTTLNRWRSQTFLQLSVKELTAVVQPSTVTEGDDVKLTCVSGCPTPTTIVWYRDGQAVPNPVFQARREDTGRYYCAVLGQETARSAFVALNVQYAPKKVSLSISPSGDIFKGSSMTLTCSSDANPPVTQSGYSLYKDGHFIGSGQHHNISDVQPSHSGLYHCQAWNNISWRGSDLINSTQVPLDVQYRPVNVSVSMDPPPVVQGSSVNLTCSSAANPAADNYTWYRIDSPSSSSMLQVGSGQVLSLPSVNASHTGLYFCQARNRLGESNSTEVLVAMMKEEHGGMPLPILAGLGVSLFLTLVLVLIFFWRKQRIHAEKETMLGFKHNGRGLSSSATEDESNSVYANIHRLPSSPPPVTDITPHSQRSSHREHDAPVSSEDEVTYTAVTQKPRDPSLPRHINNSRSKAGETDDAVIYAIVAKSS
ncbi:B-cell receptor CD22-like isoform X2 [Micropterus salmoides]|uniref:B-cell receptor CD22-like isoform X2 n=1 Tax=Micropterus salmoides TaxID=27706 RepID=UPI0018EDE420|nr:B-cell receptor CD22-like isoform X2 [Micropterus salmoides]